MASPAQDDGGDDDVLVVVTCIDPDDPIQDDDEVVISTTDVHCWDLPSILQHRVIKVKAHRKRLIQRSSYFHGLLGGNFSDAVLEVRVQWNQPTFVSLLASLFGSPVDVTSEKFLPLFEGALYFGMETILLDCKTWLTKALFVDGLYLLQVNDLIGIWEFGSKVVNNYLPELCTRYLAKNFIWAMSCSSFGDVPIDLLVSSIKHPHLTVNSEKHLCEALLAWIAANKERCTEDICIDLLKQVRINLLPLWFAAGKSIHQSFSMCYNGSFCGAITMLKQPSICRMDMQGDGDFFNLRIRLTEFTQRVDLSGCPQIKPVILLLSMLPFPLSSEWRKKVKQLVINHERLGASASKISWEMWPNLTFEALNEIDISNCPMLHLEVAVECFSKSFPSLQTLKAVNHSSFRTTNISQLAKRCPLLSDIDLTVDVSPVIPTRVSILSSFLSIRSSSESFDSSGSRLPVSGLYMSTPLPSNITKLTLEGRSDVNDSDLRSISDICVSLTYVSLKGCTSLSDVGISSFICKCSKLNSIVACDTCFGQQSILALCSSNTCHDHAAEHSGQKDSQGCNLQMLHMGGCKGINVMYLSKLMSQAYMLKSLCLRETQVVDDVLYNFFGSSLEVLDVSNTKVSAAAVAHVIGRNPGLRCLKARGCGNLLQQETQAEGGSKCFYLELGKSCKLDELSVGWGFSYWSLEPLKPAISWLKAIEVGLGGMLGHDGLKWLPAICPLLESVILYFQVISDDVILNLLESLRQLNSFALCHCFGETSSMCFKVSMPNLRKLRLERVAPWMNNDDLVHLTQNCANLIDLSLLGCKLLNSESQNIISSGWPGLISIHLEECGKLTSTGVVSLFDCHALEDILLRHNGCGVQKNFIRNAITKLPMLRKISLDICDAKDADFDIPEVEDRHLLSHVKIARCKSERCSLGVGGWVHRETLVLVWDTKHFTITTVKERL